MIRFRWTVALLTVIAFSFTPWLCGTALAAPMTPPNSPQNRVEANDRDLSRPFLTRIPMPNGMTLTLTFRRTEPGATGGYAVIEALTAAVAPQHGPMTPTRCVVRLIHSTLTRSAHGVSSSMTMDGVELATGKSSATMPSALPSLRGFADGDTVINGVTTSFHTRLQVLMDMRLMYDAPLNLDPLGGLNSHGPTI